MVLVKHMLAWKETLVKGNPEKPESLRIYTGILTRIIRDAAFACNVRVSSVDRDINLVRHRVDIEGIDFLTKTLPKLGKSLDKALASDGVISCCNSFKGRSGKKYPQFLGDFFDIIFDANGSVVEHGANPLDPDEVAEKLQHHQRVACAVRCVRQICYLFYKLEGSHSKESEAEVLTSFADVDQTLPEEGDEIPLSLRATQVLERARYLIFTVLKGFDPLDISPRHGPGAVATGEKPWNKMKFQRFYEKLDEVYSYPEYFFYNYTHLCDELESLESMETYSEATAKVVLVPKDSRGPRLISMEPLELQWIQQGLMTKLVQEIELKSPLTCGYVNFTDQSVNRRLALENSYTREYETLDMKEASDRVSLWLVRQLFPDNVFRCLKACRSQKTQLPGGDCITLRKFAPMGSAVCFPVEALIFWALAVSALDTRNHGWRWGLPHSLPQVYVYGDDIIAPEGSYVVLAPIFKEFFLEFNGDKCCTGKHFRESCGMDAFEIEDVTPLKIKAPWSEDLSPTAALSYVSYINSLRERGFHLAGNFLHQVITKKLGVLPVSNNRDTLPYTILRSQWSNSQVEVFNTALFRCRYNRRLQRTEVKLLQPTAVYLRTGTPGWDEVLRVAKRRQGKSIPLDYLEPLIGPSPCRHAVPHQIKMRWRWVGLNDLSSRL